jgi:hypothetical protein
MSQERFAEAIDASVTAVRSWEQGWSTPMPRYRPGMADVLGIGLVELAQLLDPDTAPSLNGHEVPKWVSHYDSLVQTAGRLIEVAQPHIPALLQTEGYAAAIERCGPLQLTDAQVIERVDVRLARAGVLDSSTPLQLVCLVAEHVLTDVVGGPAVMVAQLDHLADMADRPNVTIRVLPADGRSVCARGGFQLLTRAGEVDPFMVVTFDVDAPRYVERPEVVAIFTATLAYLDASVALPPDKSTRRIHDITEKHRR